LTPHTRRAETLADPAQVTTGKCAWAPCERDAALQRMPRSAGNRVLEAGMKRRSGRESPYP